MKERPVWWVLVILSIQRARLRECEIAWKMNRHRKTTRVTKRVTAVQITVVDHRAPCYVGRCSPWAKGLLKDVI